MWWCSGEVPVAATIVPVLLAGGHRHYYRGTITVLHSIFVYECWYNIRNHAWYSPGMYGTSDSRRVKRANIFQRTFTLNFSSEHSHLFSSQLPAHGTQDNKWSADTDTPRTTTTTHSCSAFVPCASHP